MTKTKTPDQYDVSPMSITPEPYEKFASKIVTSKYDDLFSKLGENQRLKCQPEAAGRVAAQLKNWLKAHGHKNVTTKSRTNCGEGFVAVEMGRKFVGAELKQSYFEQAARNLASAEQEKTQDLFAD